MMDKEFDKVKDTNKIVEINTTPACKQVGKIEQYICTAKERSRALVLDLPFTVLPRQVVIHLVYFVAVLWLNSLPAAAGVSNKYSPHEIVLGCEIDFKKHCKATFGSYVEAHDNPTISNTMLLCIFPGIFLGSTGNCQGTHKVFDINTGVVKKNRSITPLPMPDRVIKIVNNWGRHHQQEDKAKTLEFLNHKQQQYTWDNDDLEDNKGLVELDIAHPDIPAKFPVVDLESEQPQHHQVVEIIEESKDKRIYAGQRNASLNDLPQQNAGVSTAVNKVDTFEFPEDDADTFHELPTPPTLLIPPEMITDNNAENPVDNKEAAKIEEVVLGSTTVDGLRHSTRIPIPPCTTKVSFKNKLYSNGTYKDGTVHITVDAGHDNDHPFPINPDLYMHVLGIALLHYSNPNVLGAAFARSNSFKAGLKKFGEIGEKAAITKLIQLHDYTTYHPIHAHSLSPKECQKALSSLMNIIEKQDGRVCACTCADGSKEQFEPGYKKEDGASPTVATDSILISATIDAHKGRDVATIDIPDAFLNAYNNKETIMLLKGRLTKLMVQVNPQLYCKYIIHNCKNFG
jgi:hypothetical protein